MGDFGTNELRVTWKKKPQVEILERQDSILYKDVAGSIMAVFSALHF